jgi:UDP-glucuronate 4-epimerase
MRALVTGAAGFVGGALTAALLRDGWDVLGVDALTPYYDPELKAHRLREVLGHPRFTFVRGDLGDSAVCADLMQYRSDVVFHLAAQPGVRYSVSYPRQCMDANVSATIALLDALRTYGAGHIVFASSSSVYGRRASGPFTVQDALQPPTSPYAASKVAGEALIAGFASSFGLAATICRLFTVYGPRGRPDMAYFRFASALQRGTEVPLFDGGRMLRDFTYIDDVVACLQALARSAPAPGSVRTVNIGAGQPRLVSDLVTLLEQAWGHPCPARDEPGPAVDVALTHAGTTGLRQQIGFVPSVPLEVGVARFAEWFQQTGHSFGA